MNPKEHPILKNINEAGIYSAGDIASNGWFYWLKGKPESVRKTVTRYLMDDLSKGKNSILQASLKGDGPSSRWYVRGENIIRFVIQYEDAGIIN